MATRDKTSRFILLPSRGVRAAPDTASPATAEFLSSLHRAAGTRDVAAATEDPPLHVIASVHGDGAKLVEMDARMVARLRAKQPGLRIIPEVFYVPAIAPRPMPIAPPARTTRSAAPPIAITLTVSSKADRSPIAGCMVVAFTDFVKRVGASGTTDGQGRVALNLGAASKKVERLYVYSPKSFWNGLMQKVTLTSSSIVTLVPIDLGFQDGLRFFYGNKPLTAGTGVTVGVVDTGISPEPDLSINGGFNAVTGESPNDFGDNGEGHGTHVAGIIAARGTPPTGIRGVAPGVTLRSYRVFGKNKPSASNFDILKAIDRAVADGCDILNMSLGGQGEVDAATHDAISHARAHGTLIFAASGNDDRSPVGAPARDPMALAISAMGRKGTYPANAVEVGDVMAPLGTDKKNYITSFSDIGIEIDLTAPGDGIISTYPTGYAVLDGTSMACPAAVGMAAQLLATQPAILSMARNQARSDAMAQFVLQHAKTLGFPVIMQGQGMLL